MGKNRVADIIEFALTHEGKWAGQNSKNGRQQMVKMNHRMPTSTQKQRKRAMYCLSDDLVQTKATVWVGEVKWRDEWRL